MTQNIFLYYKIRENRLYVGCGIGLQVLLLAEAVGPYGHVTGIDIVLELLAFYVGG